MEYQKHKCCDQSCDCFEISRVMDRINLLGFYQVYNVAKEAYVFSFSYIRNCFEGRISRRAKRFIGKALPPNIDHSSETQGIPEPWSQAPPPKRNTIRIFYKTSEHQQFPFADSILRLGITLSFRGVNNAPPSVKAREYVHEFIHRENQTESISI